MTTKVMRGAENSVQNPSQSHKVFPEIVKDGSKKDLPREKVPELPQQPGLVFYLVKFFVVNSLFLSAIVLICLKV